MHQHDAISGPSAIFTPATTLATSAIGWSFVLAVMLAPLVHGGNVALAWGINAAVFGMLLTLSAAHAALTGRIPRAWRRLGWLAVAGLLVLTWAVVQAAGWTPRGWHHPAWVRLADVPGLPDAGAISADPGRTAIATLRLATTFAVFLCAAMLGQDRSWARRILLVIAIAGTLQAVAALADVISTRQSAERIAASLSGTFVNRNHFAIYLGLALVCGWSVLLDMMRRAWRSQRAQAGRDLGGSVISAMNAAVLCVLLAPAAIALLMTTSRAGIALSVLALSSVICIEVWRAGRGSRAPVVAMAVLLAVGLGSLLLAYGAMLSQRLADGGLAADITPRLEVARITLGAIADRPLAGHGYGTFPAVFASYRDGSLPLAAEWNEAHNVYLETLLELGLPAGLLLLGTILAVFTRCIRGALERRRRQELPAAAAAALLLVGGHALVDFSIQLQGIALTVAAIAGVGFAQAWRTSRSSASMQSSLRERGAS